MNVVVRISERGVWKYVFEKYLLDANLEQRISVVEEELEKGQEEVDLEEAFEEAPVEALEEEEQVHLAPQRLLYTLDCRLHNFYHLGKKCRSILQE